MSLSKTLSYYKEKFLNKAGLILVVLALIGFWISFSLNWFTATSTDENGIQQIRTVGTLGSKEAYVEADPDGVFEDTDRPFPLIPTLTLIAGLALFTRRGTRNDDVDRLWNVLRMEKRIKLEHLTGKSGFDRNYVLETLPDLNLQRGTAFYHHPNRDLVIDHDSTVDWHLNSNCNNCGAAANQKVNIIIGIETLSCPYCSSSIQDPEFEKYLEAVKQKTRPKKWSFLPS